MGNTESVPATKRPYNYRGTITYVDDGPSKTVSKYISEKIPVSNDSDLVLGLEKMAFSTSTATTNLSNPISINSLDQWETNVLADPKNRLAQAAITNGAIADLVHNRKVFNQDTVHAFNTKIGYEGAPVTNQKSSGRCWLFSSTSLLRIPLMKRLNLDDFQLSQSYLFFYDKLEKCNYFLQNMIETAEYEIDSRLVSALLQDDCSDGGQWDFLINIVEKYGLVPRSVFPESFSSESTSKLNFIITNKIREYGLLLRKAKTEKNADVAALNTLKEKCVQDIYSILTITLGSPPKPDDVFTWEYQDKDKNYHISKNTPLGFYKEVVKFNVGEYFSLIHDPRNPYDALYTVDRNNNMQGGKPLEFVNAPINVLKEAVITAIKNDEAVFFGSDVGQFSDYATGTMDPEAWDYALAYNTTFKLSKAERVNLGLSQMTHAMLITGVDIVDGKPTKWRVMNSWGENVGDKGYMTMSDKWFDEFVYQVVTAPKYISKKYTDIWKSKDFKVLPRWDPYGSLA